MSDTEQRLREALDAAWGVIANVSYGDWRQQSVEWQEAAARWRDEYYLHEEAAALASTAIPAAPQPTADEGRCAVCGWPLAATMAEGCVVGNCSYRPGEGSPEYERIRARGDELRPTAPPIPAESPRQVDAEALWDVIDVDGSVMVECLDGGGVEVKMSDAAHDRLLDVLAIAYASAPAEQPTACFQCGCPAHEGRCRGVARVKGTTHCGCEYPRENPPQMAAPQGAQGGENG